MSVRLQQAVLVFLLVSVLTNWLCSMVDGCEGSRVVAMVTIMVRRGVEHVMMMMMTCSRAGYSRSAPTSQSSRHTRFVLHHSHPADGTAGITEQFRRSWIAERFEVRDVS